MNDEVDFLENVEQQEQNPHECEGCGGSDFGCLVKKPTLYKKEVDNE